MIKLGIIGSNSISKNQVFNLIGDFIHSMETEEESVGTIVIGGSLNGVDAGAREFATNFGFKYDLKLVDTRGNPNAVVDNSDALLVIWDGDNKSRVWPVVGRASSSGLKVVIIIPEKTKVKQ